MYPPGPDFFVIGAPRSGTGSLTGMLTAHPQVFMARKELHFFGKDLDYHRVPMTRERYLGHFASRPVSATRAGDASAWTLFSESAPSEIATYRPDARIIVTLRSPAEMIHSIHGLLVYGCQEDIESVDRAVRSEAERKAEHPVPEASRPKMALQYTGLGRFNTHLQRWIEVFQDRVHVVLFDDLKADANTVGDRLAAFLELDTPVSPLPPSARSQNAHRRHRSRRLQGWTQRQTNRAMIDGVVPFSPHRRLAIGLINRLNGTFAKREPMHEDTLKHIQDTLRPEIEALGEHLGRDLSHWVSS
jgi:hypothetical protein